jgi:hypothetical protein
MDAAPLCYGLDTFAASGVLGGRSSVSQPSTPPGVRADDAASIHGKGATAYKLCQQS